MRIPRWFLKRASISDTRWEADWAAYILFDGKFAAKLIDLGHQDALARAAEIRKFFSSDVA
jgi:NTE family protein